MDMTSPSFKMRFMYMSRYDDEERFDEFKKKFTVMPVLDRIRCPVPVQAVRTTSCRRSSSPARCCEAPGAEEIRRL